MVLKPIYKTEICCESIGSGLKDLLISGFVVMCVDAFLCMPTALS